MSNKGNSQFDLDIFRNRRQILLLILRKYKRTSSPAVFKSSKVINVNFQCHNVALTLYCYSFSH